MPLPNRFEGDGRQTLKPSQIYLRGVSSMPVRRSNCRFLVAAFERTGRSNHSQTGSTLWVILEHCYDNGIPFQLKAYPGLGYEVTKLEPLP